ncbi:MAG: transposase [Cytophagales bacterium]
MELNESFLQFFTATIHEWKHLLKPDKYKIVIADSLKFLVDNKRVKVYAFAIMSNHLHIIWQMVGSTKREDVQRDFLKFTSQNIKFDLVKNHPEVLKHFEVNVKDRKHQFWLRNSLSIDLYSHEVFIQKIEYLHYNPVKAGLCSLEEEYRFSSAKFYLNGKDEFGFFSHYQGE